MKSVPAAAATAPDRPLASDTVPAEVKRHFFSDKKQPCLHREYDVVGFDVDHCLVKYKLRPVAELIVRGMASDLHLKAGYPAQILETDPSLLGLALNNVVWDIQRGNILKLGSGRVVLRAYHGTQALNNDEIKLRYGTPPVFGALNYPTTIRSMEKECDAHWVLLTYFDCVKVPLICRVIELIDSGTVAKSYLQFARDFF